ncbi:hypothetical protein NCCP28_41080 [Niallia sp. NCCP-28]|nr:hypothetical protein NCCP28_41080 [Niallia sp. NCCP-28]
MLYQLNSSFNNTIKKITNINAGIERKTLFRKRIASNFSYNLSAVIKISTAQSRLMQIAAKSTHVNGLLMYKSSTLLKQKTG